MSVEFPRFRLLPLCLLSACVNGAPYGFEPVKAPPDDSYAPAVAAPDCRPNNDGVITREEMPFVVGVAAHIRVGEGPITVNTEGFESNGTRRWDLSTPTPETQPLARLELQNMAGQWFESSFTGADYAGPLQPGGGILGPLKIDAEGVHLLGSASSTMDPPEGRTLLIYETPVTLYPFPLQDGVHVTTNARASNATILGLPTALTDEYDVKVSGKGTLVLPDMILENTLRVTVRLRRTLVVGDVQQVTHVFVHECLGEVARMVSTSARLSESLPDDFTTAQQVWRLSL
jgi:hypothetical protein